MPKSFIVSAWDWASKLQFHVTKTVTPMLWGFREDRLEAWNRRLAGGCCVSDWSSSLQMYIFQTLGRTWAKTQWGQWEEEECNNIFLYNKFISNFSSSFNFLGSGGRIQELACAGQILCHSSTFLAMPVLPHPCQPIALKLILLRSNLHEMKLSHLGWDLETFVVMKSYVRYKNEDAAYINVATINKKRSHVFEIEQGRVYGTVWSKEKKGRNNVILF